ncbi:MAG: carboxypeptidase-like regulatory domain-containing protein, partial [Acidobacteriota bacterium]|nr:carboxypeptidase-like regulatory domain-containing protein [Acidobacteriota bacterium]
MRSRSDANSNQLVATRPRAEFFNAEKFLPFRARVLSILIVLVSLSVSSNTTAVQQRRRTTRPVSATSAIRSISVRTEPNAILWLDEVRRGTTDASGSLVLKNVSPGRHTLRVRARGFGERNLPILPAQRGVVT